MDDELRVAETGRDGDTVRFRLENTGDSKLYEFVKLFSDTRYIDLQYVDIPPGESTEVAFSGVSGGDTFTLSTSDRDEGVLFSGTLTADTPPIREQDIDELQQQELSEERWQELAAEYEDLEEEERREKKRILERLRQEYEDLEQRDAGDGSSDETDETPSPPGPTEEHQDEPEGSRPDDDTDDDELVVESLGEDAASADTAPDQDGPDRPERPSDPDTDPSVDEAPPPADDVEERVREMDEQLQERREQESSGGLSGIVDRIFGRGDDTDDDESSEIDQPPDQQSESQQTPEEGDERSETGSRDEDQEMEDEDEDDHLLPSERVNRLETGIIGLDEKMQGGFVEGTMNLVTGKTGVGKTAFCASFLKKGAENGESGVYVTTEERQEDIRDDIESMFGWRFEELEDQGLVKILSIKPIFPSKEIDNLNRLVRSYISNLLDEVMAAVDEIDADRVIIDSVSIIEMFIRDEYMARVALASLLNNLREADVTALLTGTVPETSEGLSGGGIIEFLVDTVILLEFVPVAEEHKRTLTIRKMRRTDHDVEIFPFDITPDGIEIYDVM